jgi:hypothetical protein
VVPTLRAVLGAPPPSDWKNRNELETLVARHLDEGRAGSAARLIEDAYRPEARAWKITDQIATLRLHLGDTEGARRVWHEARNVPRPALRESRLALTYLADEQYDEAREHVARSLEGEPRLFEALYLGAMLEADASHGEAAARLARRALEAAPGTLAETSVRRLLRTIEAPEAAAQPSN